MKNLSYYNKLGFENAFSWKQEDFSGFLIWDQVEAFKSIGDLAPAFLQVNKTLMQKYNRYKFGLNFYDRFFQKLLLNKNRKDKKILFYNTQYPKLILEAKKHYSTGLIVTGKEDRLFSLKNFIGHISLNDLYQYVYYYLKEEKIDYLYQLVERLEEKLRVLRPDYVVLWNDNFPIERAIVLACKKLGITTLEIQHGLFELVSLLTSGRMIDYFLVWGQHFKDLYIKEKIRKPEEIYILGYPYGIHKPKPRKKEKCTVCYLGQTLEAFNKEALGIKLRTIEELNRISKKLNIKFFYRPHPRDNRKLIASKLPGISFTPEHEEISDTIAKGDIFISFNSTALIEAAIRSKITLQLMNYPMGADNLEKLGACTKSFQSIEQLSQYLQRIIRGSHLSEVKCEFNNYYTETRYNPGQRFIEILKKIDDK